MDAGATVIDQTRRIYRISQAVTTITQKYGKKAAIYTSRDDWKLITGHCNNSCQVFYSLPLWDFSDGTFVGNEGVPHCGDGIPGLGGFNKGFAGWQNRSGNQFDRGPSPGCNGDGGHLFGINGNVDFDFFGPTLFQ